MWRKEVTRNDCWASTINCNKCKKIGHLAKMCKLDQRNQAPHRDKERVTKSNMLSEKRKHPQSLWGLSRNRHGTCTLQTITLECFTPNSREFIAELHGVLPDSGAGANLMGVEDANRLGIDKSELIKRENVLFGAIGMVINTKRRIGLFTCITPWN